MAEVTFGADAIALDIEGLENDFQDCVSDISSSMSDDDSEEAHISFKREDINTNWVSSIEQKNRVEPKILKAAHSSFKREDINTNWVSSIEQKNRVEPKILKAAHSSFKREDLNSNWVSSIKQKIRVGPKILKAAHISFKGEDLNSNWVSSIKQKNRVEPKILKASSASKSCSIHRAPCWLPKDNSNAYRPQFISIGPYHYKMRKCQLRAMEEHKRRYLQGICSRKPEGWLEDCLTTIKRWEKTARNYYSEVIPLDSNSFVEMMVLDGCFLVELFRNCWSGKDVIFKLNWPRKTIYYDLILMENQIPFFILQHLSQKIDASERYPSLVESALNFLEPGDSTSTLVERITASNIRIRHLLHLVHVGLTLFPINFKTPSGRVGIPCASRLKERGIKFKRRDAGDAEVFNIKFDFDKGVIEIPRIIVWDQAKIKFLNLIAFEQCYPHCPKYITAYFYFMDCLINAAKDVEILYSEGIIEEALGSEELVASHFNRLSRGTLKYSQYFYLSDVCEKINKYSKRRWPRLRASLVHDYFNNPWAIISFLAALILLLLTMTQTFFTSFPKFASGN